MLLTLATIAATLQTPVSSATAKPGLDVPCAPSTCTVVNVTKRGKRAKDGSLTIMVEAADGTRCFATVKAHSGTGREIAALGVGGLFIKGKHARLDAGDTVACDE